MAQLVEAASPSASEFKSKFWKNRKLSNDKKSACNVDTLYYARYNAGFNRFLNVTPPDQTGIGVYYAIDDTVWIYGFNFYANAMSPNTPITCNVYYANKTNKEPAGVPLASDTFLLPTGFTSLPFMLRRFTFTNPVRLVSDFVITIETTNLTQLIVASNNWDTKDGKGNFYSSIKFSTGWQATGITVGSVPFDADFYLEPAVGYKIAAQFEHDPQSCLGNAGPFKFVNTTTHVLNEQFSPEAIDTTLDDNFFWDYGDGSPIDTILHGENIYPALNDYWVEMDVDFNSWTGSCQDDSLLLLEEPDLNANFQSKATDLLVEFTDKSIDAESWQWDFGDNSNGSQSPNPSHIYANFGLYQVSLTVKNKGCTSSTTLALNLIDTHIGIENIEVGDVKAQISPNPTSDVLNVQIRSSNLSEVTWDIFSIQGRQLLSGSMTIKTKIDVKEIGKGVYFIRFNDGQSIQTKRFIIQ